MRRWSNSLGTTWLGVRPGRGYRDRVVVMAKLVDARPDFRPRVWLEQLPPLDEKTWGSRAVKHMNRRTLPPTKFDYQMLRMDHDQGL